MEMNMTNQEAGDALAVAAANLLSARAANRAAQAAAVAAAGATAAAATNAEITVPQQNADNQARANALKEQAKQDELAARAKASEAVQKQADALAAYHKAGDEATQDGLSEKP
jgi:hypothetical protein